VYFVDLVVVNLVLC